MKRALSRCIIGAGREIENINLLFLPIMSGHSKWSTIKRQKATTDQAKGKLFSKLAKAISLAVKAGGGGDPDLNPKLRVAIETARAANMPKVNIERAITKGTGEGADIEEVAYEGYGPGSVAVIVEAATDNRNRTGQEIKNIFEKRGGKLAGPGAVSFNFAPKGLIVIEYQQGKDKELQMLSLIDLGAEDIEDEGESLELFVEANELFDIKKKVEQAGFKVRGTHLVQKPKSLVSVDREMTRKIQSLLEALDDHDDVQEVYTNADFIATN